MKQETVEEAAEYYVKMQYPMGVEKEYPINDFIQGAKWQQEQDKEMLKEQIIQAYNDGKAAVIHIEQNMSLEEYYDKNYKNENNV